MKSSTSRSWSLPKLISSSTKRVGDPKAPRSTERWMKDGAQVIPNFILKRCFPLTS
jgi:hypothetical protein